MFRNKTQKLCFFKIFVMLIVILVAVLVFIPSRGVESVENSTELNQSSELSEAYTSTTGPFEKNVNQSEKISQYEKKDNPEEETRLKDSGDLRPYFMPRSFGSVDKWPKLSVTWKFNNTLHKEPHRVNNVLREAAARWSSVTPITLVETNDTKYDIEILFLRTRDVKPGKDINGKGGPYLSHSTGPKSPRCYIHFNAGVKWDFNLNQSNQSDVRQLLRSAMFGFGITLGLAETNHTNSVMNTDTNMTVLQEDDINRLQKLYGMVEPDDTEDLSAKISTTNSDVLDKTLTIENILQLGRLRRPKLPARLGALLSNTNVDVINIQNIIIL